MASESESNELSHIGAKGRARMVDVSDKSETAREAVAAGSLEATAEAMSAVRRGENAKGNVIETARLAGILAAKRTAELIPLCHPLAIEHIDVSIEAREDGFDIESRVRSRGRTGVEMEALTAVSVAALTLYDMMKAIDKTMVIGDIRLVKKAGGRSGIYLRDEEAER